MSNFHRDHCAYNTVTGEIIVCSTGNNLKRWLRRANRWNRQFGYPIGKWIFVHGADWKPLLQAKVSRL